MRSVQVELLMQGLESHSSISGTNKHRIQNSEASKHTNAHLKQNKTKQKHAKAANEVGEIREAYRRVQQDLGSFREVFSYVAICFCSSLEIRTFQKFTNLLSSWPSQ